MINVKGIKYSVGRMSGYLLLTVILNVILVGTVDSLNFKRETIVDTQGIVWDKKMVLDGSSFKHYLFLGDSGEGIWVTKNTYDKYNVGNHVVFNKQVAYEQEKFYTNTLFMLFIISVIGITYYLIEES